MACRGEDDSQVLIDACCDETSQCGANPGAKVAEVEALVEMAKPVKVCSWHHADPHCVQLSAAPHLALGTRELVLASFCANPSQWENGLAFPHMTVLNGLGFHGNHFEED